MHNLNFFNIKDSYIDLRIWIKPNSSQRGIQGYNEHGLILAIGAPAIDGKANQALIETLGSIIQIPKSQIELIKGHKSRQKVVRIPNNPSTQLFIAMLTLSDNKPTTSS